MSIALEVKGLKKYYHYANNEVKAVDGIDLVVKKGDFVSIMGPSGAGKSTLLYLIATLEEPDEGEIYIGNEKVNSLKDKYLSEIRRKKIGFIFQFYNILPELTCKDNVLVPVMLDGKNTKNYEKKALELLELVGLKDKANVKPSQLSGGQQQRVAIARALINDPEFILADEPIGNLDSKSGEQIMNLLSDLNKKGITIIQVTHSEKSAHYGNRTVRVCDGKIV